MSSDEETSFYEDDEDPQELWAKYEAAKARGDVVYTVPPENSRRQAQVTTVSSNYVTVTAPVGMKGLYGHLGAFTPDSVSRRSATSTSTRGTVQE